tara:strand:- start:459 stop:671 length:213 start_codon:yes stop_codon:yes gene_type:complete
LGDEGCRYFAMALKNNSSLTSLRYVKKQERDEEIRMDVVIVENFSQISVPRTVLVVIELALVGADILQKH